MEQVAPKRVVTEVQPRLFGAKLDAMADRLTSEGVWVIICAALFLSDSKPGAFYIYIYSKI